MLAVFLLFYGVKENEKKIYGRKNGKEIVDIKNFLSAKLTDTPEKPEKDSRTEQSCRKTDAQKSLMGLAFRLFLHF